MKKRKDKFEILRIFLCLYFVFNIHSVDAQITDESISIISSKINGIRAKDVKCGDELMPGVSEIEWNDDLYTVSSEYAFYMSENRHFAHASKKGEDAGDRLDEIGYNWRFVGENLALGQHDFDEVLEDWLQSKSHCKMLMNPNMRHFALARYKRYWVQTLAALQGSQ